MPLDPTSEFWSLGPRQIVGCETSEDGGLVWKVDVRKRETRTLTTHAPRLEGFVLLVLLFLGHMIVNRGDGLLVLCYQF
jgi:hypothetical protein